MLLLITEKLREILTRQCCIQSRHDGAYSVQFCFFPSIQHVHLENKAAPASASGINFAHRPDDNKHLIIHECSGLEPEDAQGLRAIRDFISDRTDPSCPASERLHAIW